MTLKAEDMPATKGGVRQAIHARANVRRFQPEPITREVVQGLLDSAVQAPNHRRTMPWRFLVVDKPGPIRVALADLSYEAALSNAVNQDDGARARAEAKRQEILATPLLVFVYSTPGRTEEESRENYAAVCCAVQNLLLAAVEEGLAGGWSTGGLSTHPAVRKVIGADPSWDLVGLLYVGKPASDLPARQRPSADQYTHWLSDSERESPADAGGVVAHRV